MGIGRRLAIVWLGILTCMVAASAFAQANAEALTSEQFESRWAELLQDEPTATRALLVLARHPRETSQFLAAKLKPLVLREERLDELLIELGSNEASRWQEAFRELEYYDPRLAMGLEEIMDLGLAQKSPTRDRLVAILSGRSSEHVILYKQLTLEPVGKDGFNFRGSQEDDPDRSISWWAEHKIERINSISMFHEKKPWTRAARALALLESFGTMESWAIIQSMSTGHPDALPTRAALQMLAGRQK